MNKVIEIPAHIEKPEPIFRGAAMEET